MKEKSIYLIAILTVALDQICKHMVSVAIPLDSSISVFRGLFFISAVHNFGGAFGLFPSWAGSLAIVTVVVVVVILLFAHRRPSMPPIVRLALGLQLGGALGNLIDRLRFGYVIDFLDFRVWPVFNIADIAITVGVILLAYYLFFGEGSRQLEPKQ